MNNPYRRTTRDAAPLLAAAAAGEAAGAAGGAAGAAGGGGGLEALGQLAAGGGGGGGQSEPLVGGNKNDFSYHGGGAGDEEAVEQIGPKDILQIVVVAMSKFSDADKAELGNGLQALLRGNGNDDAGVRVPMPRPRVAGDSRLPAKPVQSVFDAYPDLRRVGFVR
jgi:hypothetical protein